MKNTTDMNNCAMLQRIFGENYHAKLSRVYHDDKNTLICVVCRHGFDTEVYLESVGKAEHCNKAMKYGKIWSMQCLQCDSL